MSIDDKNVSINEDNVKNNEVVKKTYPNLKPFVKGGHQPSSEAQINGWTKRREKMEFKESTEFFLNRPSRIINYDGANVQLNSQDEIAKNLVEMAQKGNLKAIELLTKIMPNWLAVQKTENVNLDIPFKIVTEFKDYRADIKENKLK